MAKDPGEKRKPAADGGDGLAAARIMAQRP
jgi:hypothetical protein